MSAYMQREEANIEHTICLRHEKKLLKKNYNLSDDLDGVSLYYISSKYT